MSTSEPLHARPGRRAVSLALMDGAAGNVDVVERFLAAFDHRWPTEAELDELLAREIRFVERPSLVSPKGSERDLAAMRAGIEAGRRLLASAVLRGARPRGERRHGRHAHALERRAGDRCRPVVEGHDAGARGASRTTASQPGRIVEIEQHDCYEPVEAA